MDNTKSLKARQLNAVQLLAVGVPAYKVAAQLEVSTMTIYRWQKLPAFEEKLNAITTSGLGEIAKKMNATTLTAVETLQEILCDMTQPTLIRMKAALGVLGSVASVNNMLEKNVKHGVADFDLQQRFSEHAFTFDANGNRFSAVEFRPSDSEEVEV